MTLQDYNLLKWPIINLQHGDNLQISLCILLYLCTIKYPFYVGTIAAVSIPICARRKFLTQIFAD